MKKQLENRLKELKAEFENGQKKLADLESEAVNVRNTVLRISGAIQVIEEELAKAEEQAGSEGKKPDDTNSSPKTKTIEKDVAFPEAAKK